MGEERGGDDEGTFTDDDETIFEKNDDDATTDDDDDFGRERDRERSLNERRRREKTTMTSRILKEGEGEEEMMLEDDDPDNPANSKPKGPIGRAFDFLSGGGFKAATSSSRRWPSASGHVQTTEELEKKVKEKDFEKESVVPGAQQFAEYLLEFRQFIDEKSSHYLDPISDNCCRTIRRTRCIFLTL